MKKRYLVLLVLAVAVLFVILLPSLNSKETMTYDEAASNGPRANSFRWTGKRFITWKRERVNRSS